jgi:hypothetical protein
LLPEIQALRQAIEQAELAKPEQEPVNTMPTKIVGPNLEQILNAAGFYKREWVGLNWDDIPDVFVGDIAFMQGAKWALAKLKEKNGG